MKSTRIVKPNQNATLNLAIALMALLTLTDTASAQAPPTSNNNFRRPFDGSKMTIESPVKLMLRSDSFGTLDRTRAAAPALPIEYTSATTAPSFPARINTANTAKPAVSPTVATETKPADRVQPGLVMWHQDMNLAMKRSSESGKPVLLFQMMGRLDDRFC